MQDVLILESPGLADIETGDRRGELIERQLRLLRVPCHLKPVATSAHFIGTVVASGPKSDVLHLSMHGNEKGLGLTDGTVVEWTTMQFLALAAASRMLVLDACRSAAFIPSGDLANGLNLLQPGLGASPPRFVLTMMNDVYFSDSALAWGLFYSSLSRATKGVPMPSIEPRSVKEALERVKGAGLPKICAWYSSGGRHVPISPWSGGQ